MPRLLRKQPKLVKRDIYLSCESELRIRRLRATPLILLADAALEFGAFRWRQIVDVRPSPVSIEACLRRGSNFRVIVEFRYGQVFDVLFSFLA
jgi:hypothetical protein